MFSKGSSTSSTQQQRSLLFSVVFLFLVMFIVYIDIAFSLRRSTESQEELITTVQRSLHQTSSEAKKAERRVLTSIAERKTKLSSHVKPLSPSNSIVLSPKNKFTTSTATGFEGWEFDLKCDEGTITSIELATWGGMSYKDEDEDLHRKPIFESSTVQVSRDMCTKCIDVQTVIAKMCIGHKHCNIPKISSDFFSSSSDPCPGLTKQLNVRATCSEKGHKSELWFERRVPIVSNTIPLNNTKVGNVESPLTCGWGYEVDFVVLKCAPGMTMKSIESAAYGIIRGGCERYPMEQPVYSPCAMKDVRRDFEKPCLGRPSCRVYVPLKHYGDPCPGEKKKAFVVAKCG